MPKTCNVSMATVEFVVIVADEVRVCTEATSLAINLRLISV